VIDVGLDLRSLRIGLETGIDVGLDLRILQIGLGTEIELDVGHPILQTGPGTEIDVELDLRILFDFGIEIGIELGGLLQNWLVFEFVVEIELGGHAL